ncbi:MAG: hypothetical protein AAF621_06680, partial [Pseudomonadota bacterium]
MESTAITKYAYTKLNNQKLVNQASLTLYISDDMLQDGGKYTGPHHHGGVKLYSDALVEACL